MADQDRDWRDNNNTQMVTIGQNLVVAVNTLNNTINTRFPNWVTPPANSTASGVAGQVAYSGSASTTAYLFVCLTSGSTGNGLWGRVQLTTSF